MGVIRKTIHAVTLRILQFFPNAVSLWVQQMMPFLTFLHFKANIKMCVCVCAFKNACTSFAKPKMQLHWELFSSFLMQLSYIFGSTVNAHSIFLML